CGGCPQPARPMASAILGNCVVFPEPVSPQTITTWCARRAASISVRRALTGKDSGNSMTGKATGFGDERKAWIIQGAPYDRSHLFQPHACNRGRRHAL